MCIFRRLLGPNCGALQSNFLTGVDVVLLLDALLDEATCIHYFVLSNQLMLRVCLLSRVPHGTVISSSLEGLFLGSTALPALPAGMQATEARVGWGGASCSGCCGGACAA